ncbi:MAG: hypothetical protein JWR51_4506 [Devosia sp.]|nr:hypothetical protein [Devosia sp.]
MPLGHSNRQALAVAGDNAGAQKLVAEFIDRLGFDAVDVPSPVVWCWPKGPDLAAAGAVSGNYRPCDRVRKSLQRRRRAGDAAVASGRGAEFLVLERAIGALAASAVRHRQTLSALIWHFGLLQQ